MAIHSGELRVKHIIISVQWLQVKKMKLLSNSLGNCIIIFKNCDTTHYILFLNDFYHGRSRHGSIWFSNWRSNRISSSYICTKRQRPPRRTRRLNLKPKKNFLFFLLFSYFIIYLRFHTVQKVFTCTEKVYRLSHLYLCITSFKILAFCTINRCF